MSFLHMGSWPDSASTVLLPGTHGDDDPDPSLAGSEVPEPVSISIVSSASTLPALGVPLSVHAPKTPPQALQTARFAGLSPDSATTTPGSAVSRESTSSSMTPLSFGARSASSASSATTVGSAALRTPPDAHKAGGQSSSGDTGTHIETKTQTVQHASARLQHSLFAASSPSESYECPQPIHTAAPGSTGLFAPSFSLAPPAAPALSPESERERQVEEMELELGGGGLFSAGTVFFSPSYHEQQHNQQQQSSAMRLALAQPLSPRSLPPAQFDSAAECGPQPEQSTVQPFASLAAAVADITADASAPSANTSTDEEGAKTIKAPVSAARFVLPPRPTVTGSDSEDDAPRPLLLRSYSLQNQHEFRYRSPHHQYQHKATLGSPAHIPAVAPRLLARAASLGLPRPRAATSVSQATLAGATFVAVPAVKAAKTASATAPATATSTPRTDHAQVHSPAYVGVGAGTGLRLRPKLLSPERSVLDRHRRAPPPPPMGLMSALTALSRSSDDALPGSGGASLSSGCSTASSSSSYASYASSFPAGAHARTDSARTDSSRGRAGFDLDDLDAAFAAAAARNKSKHYITPDRERLRLRKQTPVRPVSASVSGCWAPPPPPSIAAPMHAPPTHALPPPPAPPSSLASSAAPSASASEIALFRPVSYYSAGGGSYKSVDSRSRVAPSATSSARSAGFPLPYISATASAHDSDGRQSRLASRRSSLLSAFSSSSSSSSSPAGPASVCASSRSSVAAPADIEIDYVSAATHQAFDESRRPSAISSIYASVAAHDESEDVDDSADVEVNVDIVYGPLSPLSSDNRVIESAPPDSPASNQTLWSCCTSSALVTPTPERAAQQVQASAKDEAKACLSQWVVLVRPRSSSKSRADAAPLDSLMLPLCSTAEEQRSCLAAELGLSEETASATKFIIKHEALATADSGIVVTSPSWPVLFAPFAVRTPETAAALPPHASPLHELARKTGLPIAAVLEYSLPALPEAAKAKVLPSSALLPAEPVPELQPVCDQDTGAGSSAAARIAAQTISDAQRLLKNADIFLWAERTGQAADAPDTDEPVRSASIARSEEPEDPGPGSAYSIKHGFDLVNAPPAQRLAHIHGLGIRKASESRSSCCDADEAQILHGQRKIVARKPVPPLRIDIDAAKFHMPSVAVAENATTASSSPETSPPPQMLTVPDEHDRPLRSHLGRRRASSALDPLTSHSMGGHSDGKWNEAWATAFEHVYDELLHQFRIVGTAAAKLEEKDRDPTAPGLFYDSWADEQDVEIDGSLGVPASLMMHSRLASEKTTPPPTAGSAAAPQATRINNAHQSQPLERNDSLDTLVETEGDYAPGPPLSARRCSSALLGQGPWSVQDKLPLAAQLDLRAYLEGRLSNAGIDAPDQGPAPPAPLLTGAPKFGRRRASTWSVAPGLGPQPGEAMLALFPPASTASYIHDLQLLDRST